MLFIFIINIITSTLDAAAFNQTGLLPLVIALALSLPGIGVTCRRLHDTDRSAWWMLVILIPIVGAVLLCVWYCRKGTEGNNRFGDDPLATLAVG